MLKPIKTRKQHKAALKRIDQLMNAAAGTLEAAELEVLAILVEKYERTVFPIDPPTPIDAIRFRMEQMGYSQADLARVLSSRSSGVGDHDRLDQASFDRHDPPTAR